MEESIFLAELALKHLADPNCSDRLRKAGVRLLGKIARDLTVPRELRERCRKQLGQLAASWTGEIHEMCEEELGKK